MANQTIQSRRATLLAIAILLFTTSSYAQVEQWPAAQGGNDHWYQVMAAQGGISWDDARAAATAAGGHLATVTSAPENAFVFNLSNRDVYWYESGGRANGPHLGGFQPDPEGLASDQGWAWVTGETWAYTAWDGGEPNDFQMEEDSISYSNNTPNRTSEWNDSPRTSTGKISYVIEYETLPDSDGDGIDELTDNCQFIANPGQADGDGDGIGNRCDADLNNDCIVNAADLGLLRTVFFTDDAAADFNGDGVVNAQDLGIMRTLFFLVPGPSTQQNDCG